MKLLIIRHGEPNYRRDGLTEKGRRESGYLSEWISRFDSDVRSEQGAGRIYYYTSPYGRAKETADIALSKLGCTAEVLPWLKEFDVQIRRPDTILRKHVAWDWLPQDWTRDERFYLADRWSENERMAAARVGEEYQRVTAGFDAFLTRHGYVREGGYYRAEQPNHDTLVLFCHFGVCGVMLSHLWGVSPMPVWQGSCLQPTSVTTLVTEERRKGIASFRMLAFGEITHLYDNGEPASFAGRFCECYDDDTRHD